MSRNVAVQTGSLPSDTTLRSGAHGKGVVVLGMHRSGTSAVAGLLHLAGVPLPDRRHVVGRGWYNVKGHWEVQPLNRLNESLLRRFGGDWSAPPRLPERWTEDPRIRRTRARARRVFSSIMPGDAWLWKDPRLCLTLPFWEGVAGDAMIFLVLRNPLEVSRSLQHRNGFSHPLSLALWEAYMAGAAQAAARRAVTVVAYEDVIGDPIAWCRGARAWLEAGAVPCGPMADDETVEALIDPSLRHSRHSLDELGNDHTVSPQQLALHTELLARVGTHSSFSPLAPQEPTPWAAAILDERRPGRKFAHRHHRVRRAVGRAVAKVIRR